MAVCCIPSAWRLFLCIFSLISPYRDKRLWRYFFSHWLQQENKNHITASDSNWMLFQLISWRGRGVCVLTDLGVIKTEKWRPPYQQTAASSPTTWCPLSFWKCWACSFLQLLVQVPKWNHLREEKALPKVSGALSIGVQPGRESGYLRAKVTWEPWLS